MRIHLNIGSNIGDRMAMIGRAVALLSRHLPPGRMLLSDYIESEPWGYDSPNPFLNRGVLLICAGTIQPIEVLNITRQVELAVGSGSPHRNADGSYRDRPIDIDIIDIDGLTVATPRLTLPHPRAALRPFVAIPMEALNRRAREEQIN